MKRQLIYIMIILPLLSLFFSLEVYAQGDGKLPGTETKTKTKPAERETKSTPKIERAALTTVAYAERLSNIDANYRKDDPASIKKTVDDLNELVELAPDDSYRSLAYERLIRIHLDVRNDFVKAEAAMDRKIKANGVVSIPISFDNKWRPMAKSRAGDLAFKDKRVGWLRIQAGQLTIFYASDPGPRDKPLVSLTGQQIAELSKTLVAAYNLVRITNNESKQYDFAPGTMRQAEADLVIKLIQKHVMGKAY